MPKLKLLGPCLLLSAICLGAAPFDETADADRIIQAAFEHGILFLGCGPSTIRIAPPLIVTKEEADVAMDVLEESISMVSSGA